MERQLYVLMDLENLNHLQAPLRSTQRIKYTCFCVSRKYLVFGATSGGLYIFKREPCTFLQLIPSKDGVLSRVEVSPNEKLVAYATSRGLVVLVELHSGQQQQQQQQSRRLQVSQEHVDAEVTALQWGSSSELYVGDSLGRVSLCTVSVSMTKNIFHAPSLQLMQLDSAVVQLAYHRHILLISTVTRCYVSDTRKEQYKQVGLKLREGQYGACFLTRDDMQEEEPSSRQTSFSQFDLLANHEKLLPQIEDENVRVFCARPGARLWEARQDGTVLSTHQFRQVLADTPPTSLVTTKARTNQSINNDKHTFNFTKLFSIANKFIFTFKSNGIYIFDPDNAEVIAWNNELDDIVDAQIFNDTIYVWLTSGLVHAITLSSIEKCIMRLYFRKQYTLCAQVCSRHVPRLMKNLPSSRKLHFLVDLGEKLVDLGFADLQQQILPLVEEIARIAPEKSVPQKLKSGIFVVSNNHSLKRDESEGSLGLHIFRSLTGGNSRKLSERSRSLSSSPEGRRRRKSGSKLQELVRQSSSSSLHSLPDLHSSPLRQKATNKAPNGHASRMDESWESRYGMYSDMFYIPDAPFSVMSSPDTIAALKDLTQILSVKITSSTKTLKEKWQALEGKVRSLSQDAPVTPHDVRSAGDYVPPEPPSEQQEFETLLPNGMAFQLKRKQEESIVQLDLSTTIELCDQIKCQSDDQLDSELFTSICDICDQYAKHKQSETEHIHWLENSVKVPFPFHLYFDANQIITINECLLNQLKSKNIVKNLKSWIPKVDFDSDYPDLFKNMYSSYELKLDTLVSRVISMWSTILDAEQILEALLALALPCYFMSWCSVLNHFQQDVISFITSESRENIRKLITSQNYPLPKLLNVMYLILRVSSVEGMDICLTIGEKVKIRDFCYVILKLQQQKKEETPNKYIQRYCQNIFLSYLVKLIQNGRDVSTECFIDREVFEFTLSSFLEINSIVNGLCSCGFPQPHSLRCTPLQFEPLGKKILQYFEKTDSDFYLLLCGKLGLWRELFNYKQDQGSYAILPYVIQLDCPSLLSELDLSEMLWRELLQMKRTLETCAQCLNCGSALTPCKWKLTWTQLGQCLIKALGAEIACDLMMQYGPSELPNGLSSEFFQACIFSKMASLCGQRSRLAVVDAFSQTNAEPPQLFSPEVAGMVSEALGRDLALQGQMPTDLPTSGSLGHHWGVHVQVRDAQCSRCTLQLSDPVLLHNGGVRVFPCTHAFHTTCVRKLSECAICSPIGEHF
ncbi:hypothetical protein B566_EDAN006581 [Ephemera danica]|nr:hypothetical protein B566_EDAN006581 [Ephemera danica]